MSLVSVIIPAFNAAASICVAIDSVLSQTLQDFEIIVSDDGSTDNTALVVSRYRSDPRVRYMFHDNRGTSHAKNIAARQAKGEYLAFLDADDTLDRTALERIVQQLRVTGAVWCIVDVVKRIGDDRIIRCSQFPSGNLLLGILEKDFVTRSPFYLRSSFLASGMYDEDLAVREDWDINIRMIEGEKFHAKLFLARLHCDRQLSTGTMWSGRLHRSTVHGLGEQWYARICGHVRPSGNRIPRW